MSKSRRIVRGLLALTASLSLVTIATGAALAAVPANDDRANATIIGALPFNDSLDTTDATPQGSDPDCSSGPDDPTVWYSFTPATAGQYGVSTFGSDYDTTLLVAEQDGGGLDIIDCNDDVDGLTSGIAWEAQAGHKYLIMVGSCCGSPGGQLELRVRKDPLPSDIEVIVARRGTIGRYGGAAIHGFLRCTNGGGASGSIELSVKQRAGRFIIRGEGSGRARCNRTWKGGAQGNIGVYKPGTIAVRVVAFVCNPFGCIADAARQAVTLERR